MALLDIISPLVKPIGDYFNRRQDIKAKKQERKDELELAKHNAKVARVERGDITERDYDLMVLQNAASTIIDEVMIIWVLTMVTFLFIPPLAPYAVAGFTTLASVPTWFELVFIGCFISKLGLRFLFSGRQLLGHKVK